MANSQGSVKVACAQIEPQIGERSYNLATIEAWTRRAAEWEANIVVFPELASSGYVFESKEEAYSLSESAGDGPTVNRLREISRELDIMIVCGLNERDGDKLYNSAVLVDGEEAPAVYRKVHLWDYENEIFTPGNLGIPVFDTRFGRISMLICYDCWFPESFRSCALNGADLICVSTNWVPIPGQRADQEAMANILIKGAAHSNSIFIAAADRVGVERSQKFIGQSLIASYTGWPVGGPASETAQELIIAALPLEAAKKARFWGKYNHVLNDRRSDQYTLGICHEAW